ncbi:MAG: Asp-tRNA(Asn)/Glu-tRNA(Gln) amidotransferase subunit GatA [Phycisphaerales bacterium]|nr:Asp-tRNA(Asn)/Glu-tRNA(Gln) amidotransferase subunit GatA [Phycisphaerales bacterium]
MVALAAQVRRGAIKSRQMVESCLARISAHDKSLHCFNQVFADEARAEADAIDRRIARGEEAGVLAGIPIAIKDNLATRLGRTTCSSKFLAEYRSPFDATVIERIIAAGAIVIGKTNLDEFAMGSSTENSAFGPTLNPWDPERVPGGSSGGSAAAVAAGMCIAALGSDTGGSIRQPAAFCGCVGFKPSYGRVSRFGLVAFGSSLDQVGPLTRTLRDAALLTHVIAGADHRDSTCVNQPSDILPSSATLGELTAAQLPSSNRRVRIGIPRQYRAGNSPAVDAALARAVEALTECGCELVEVDLPMTAQGISTYYVIAPAEACANLARFDGVRYGRRASLGATDSLFDLYAKSRSEGFGPEVQRRIMLGTYALSSGYYDAFYKRALQVRRLIKQEYDAAFARCDALLGPTTPTSAFLLGGCTDPLAMYMCDVYTVNTNIAGICALSLPAGFQKLGDRTLPIGLQLQSQAFADRDLLGVVGSIVERAISPAFALASCI